MTVKLTECISLTNGAHFYRGDLHIHAFVASHDVKDATMTAQAIVKMAVTAKLDLIAIADHNEIQKVRAAIAAGEAADLLVIPAVELSAPFGPCC